MGEVFEKLENFGDKLFRYVLGYVRTCKIYLFFFEVFLPLPISLYILKIVKTNVLGC